MPVGRRRKSTAPRKPCGRLQQPSRERDYGTPELQAKRLALVGDSRAHVELESPLDRLSPKLSREQMWAGRVAVSTYSRFCAAILAPRVVAGQLTDYVEGSRTSSMTPEAAAEAVDRYKDIITAVRRYSFRSLKEVERIMHGSMPRNIDALAVGLTALADHLGFEAQEAA